MARRAKSSPAEDVIAIASKLPWWAALILAVVGYLTLRFCANQPFATSMVPGKAMDFLLPSMIKGLATVGQYVLPMLFVIAAGLSWYKARSTETTQNRPPSWGAKLVRSQTWSLLVVLFAPVQCGGDKPKAV